MKRRSRRNLAIAGLTVATAVAAGAFSMCNAVAQKPCKLTAIGTANIAGVRDGRELRLMAIEVTDDSRDAVQTLVSGRSLRLEQLGGEFDRYGRLVAFAIVDDGQQSLQHALLEQAAPGDRRLGLRRRPY